MGIGIPEIKYGTINFNQGGMMSTKNTSSLSLTTFLVLINLVLLMGKMILRYKVHSSLVQ